MLLKANLKHQGMRRYLAFLQGHHIPGSFQKIKGKTKEHQQSREFHEVTITEMQKRANRFNILVLILPLWC